jgi:alcohol dehydrogenase class IV
LIAALDLPSRLSALDVKRDQFTQIAEGAKDNLWVRTNPRPITTAAQLTDLLEMAW